MRKFLYPCILYGKFCTKSAATVVDRRGPVACRRAYMCPRTPYWTMLGMRYLQSRVSGTYFWIVHTPLYTAGMTRNRHLEASTVKTLESHFHGPVGTDPSTKPSELSPVGKGSSGLLDGHRLRWGW